MPARYHTLLEFSNSLKSVISRTYEKKYWIRAEIAKLNYYPKTGHCYPDLVEKEHNQIKAQMRAIIWNSDFILLNQKFKAITKQELQEGMTILFLAGVSYHPVYGISLNITDIEPAFTLGEMAREKTATIEQLKKEGIFYQNQQLALPLIPQKIAVISVETSKGYSDFQQIITGNPYHFQLYNTLFPAILQGDKAVISIGEQLDKIAARKADFDLVVVIRGGGDDVGMNCYDHYDLARKVALFPLPVYTGIGHSTNETVVEMVACRKFITPTDLAYACIQPFKDFSDSLDIWEQNLHFFSLEYLREEKRNLSEVSRIFRAFTQQTLQQEKYRLTAREEKLKNSARQYLSATHHVVKSLSVSLNNKSLQALEKEKSVLNSHQKLVRLYTKQVFKTQKASLQSLEEKIRLLDPEHVLKRGYSLTFHQGKILKGNQVPEPGDTITTRIYKGEIESTVTYFKQKKNEK